VFIAPLAINSLRRRVAIFSGRSAGGCAAEFVPGYEVSSWFGIGAPRNTPTQVVDKPNAEINAGLATPKLKAHLMDLGETPLMGSPTTFGKEYSHRRREAPKPDRRPSHWLKSKLRS